nr:hypothetical protein [Candidatus Gracilibacteria bacterium]
MNSLFIDNDNVLQFPTKKNIVPHVNQGENNLYNEGTIEFQLTRGLNLFKPNQNLADTKLLVDNRGELIRINTDLFALDGHANIWELVESPANSEIIIRAREKVIDTINDLPDTLSERVYSAREKILMLNGFRDKFDSLDDLKGIIEDLEKEDKIKWDDNSMLARLLFAFEGPSSLDFEEVRKLIPGYIQIIRNISGEFFSKVSDELFEQFERANNFSLEDLKRIYKESDYKAFRKLKSDVESFCNVYNYWDGILIVSKWAKNGYINNVLTTTGKEIASSVKDPRYLLNADINGFFNHISNNLPNKSKVEVYCGGNGSGKSTWLKSRLMMQLFYQTYGKAAIKDSELNLRDQIVFINRGGSGYGEDLSAFGNDIKRKLMVLIQNIKNGSLVFLDEFGSTIPEEEAYYLIRAILDYLNDYDTKIYLSSHNERFINWSSKDRDSGVCVYNFKSTPVKDGTVNFSYKLVEGVDNSHTLEVFRAAGLPMEILKRANAFMLGSYQVPNGYNILPFKDIVSYTREEREKLKQENKGFEGFTRYNDMIKFRYKGDESNYRIIRKYEPLGHGNRPNKYYSNEDLFFSAYHPDCLDQSAPELTFDFVRYGTVNSWRIENDNIFKASHLESTGINDKNIFSSINGTLSSLTTWGLTSDVKELQERQRFFEEIGNWSYDDANRIYKDINTFKWIFANFQDGGIWGPRLDFNYDELKRFNKSYWEGFFNGIEQYLVWEGFGRVCEWFLILVEMEDKLENLPKGFKESNKEFLGKLQQTIKLTKRYNKAEKRKDSWNEGYKTSKELAEKVCEKVKNLLVDLWGTETKTVIEQMKQVYSEIDAYSLPVDILNMDSEKRNLVVSYIDDSRIFQHANPNSSESISNGFYGMTQLIRALKGSGNLLKPLLDKLRTFDSVHANQLANYLEDFVTVPDVENLVNLVKLKRDNLEEFKNRREHYNIDREHGGTAIMELLGLIDIANQIKKLGLVKVMYNNTGEVDVREISHPGVEKTRKEQTCNDVYLGQTQFFDILEGATMGGKTFNIQSMQWVIRLSQSIGFVPAKYASLPVFDGLVYIDRILEDEKKKLSAGQNDAKSWVEIINRIKGLVLEKSKKGRYWFSIDEMISSVPARFQKGLVAALLEELTVLGQKGQISIHNPELVSNLLKNNPESYVVRHPEVEFGEKGDIKYTYKIVDGRSIDKDGHFTAYSLETAEKIGLPKVIIDRAREYKLGLRK